MLKKTMLACCKIYISESRNPHALKQIENSLTHHPKTLLINKFIDQIYNRVGYTLVSTLIPPPNPLKDAVFEMVKTAFESIDLGAHCGSHPRLGVVDHVCFHPLRDASLDDVAGLAKLVGAQIGEKLQVPVYLYGAAHDKGQTLASIRRQLNYFTPNSTNKTQWTGSTIDPTNTPLNPNYGPEKPSSSKGVITIGATKWVDNYNVPIINCTDLQLVRGIAKRVSERGGGLDSVQAMGLAHGEGVMEVACNLLDLGRVRVDQVQEEVERLGMEVGVRVGKGYLTDFEQERVVELYLDNVGK